MSKFSNVYDLEEAREELGIPPLTEQPIPIKYLVKDALKFYWHILKSIGKVVLGLILLPLWCLFLAGILFLPVGLCILVGIDGPVVLLALVAGFYIMYKLNEKYDVLRSPYLSEQLEEYSDVNSGL